MLKAKLPTQQELTSLYKEVELLRRDKKLKDDTIKFLQKEKEAIQRQLQNYEQLCEEQPLEKPLMSNEQQELEMKQLQADIEHLKDVIRRQNTLLRNAGTSANASLDRSLIKRVCTNLGELLKEVRTPMSGQVRSELEHQRDGMDRLNPNKRAETAWHFLEIVDRALMELKATQKRSSDLPDLRSSIMKYSSTPTTSSIGAKAGTNLLTTNSTSLANLSSDSGYIRKRSAGRLGRVGSRLERSVSAPALNATSGLMPHPPKAPPPSHVLTASYRNN